MLSNWMAVFVRGKNDLPQLPDWFHSKKAVCTLQCSHSCRQIVKKTCPEFIPVLTNRLFICWTHHHLAPPHSSPSFGPPSGERAYLNTTFIIIYGHIFHKSLFTPSAARYSGSFQEHFFFSFHLEQVTGRKIEFMNNLLSFLKKLLFIIHGFVLLIY